MDKKTKFGYLQAFVSVIVNVFLFAIKLWAGVVSSSIAIIADAWHTLSDSFSSLILIFGFKLSTKPADKKHPYGHGRAEIIFSVIVGTILVVVGFNFLIDSIDRLKNTHSARFGQLAYIVTLTSIILKELLAQFATRLGKKYDSPLLIADGWHHRSDALSSLFILTGIIFGKFFWWMDGVLGILMAFLLFYAAFDILKTSISHLIGEEPSAKLKSDIMKLITTNIDQQIHLHHLHVHHYGDHLEVTFHIRLKPETMLKDAHQITDKIEKLLRNEMNIEATIHVEPFYRPDQNDQSK